MTDFIEKIKNKMKPSLETNLGRAEFIGSMFFVFISLLLTAVNVAKHVTPGMTAATSMLAVGFALTALLAYNKKLIAARTLIISMVACIFTYFALSGGNDGFAILWILLVPVIGSLWVGLKGSVIISLYFQLFLIAIFYTPLRQHVEAYYTKTFMLRFPLLYFACFGAITFLMWQREGLLKLLNQASYYDALTGLRNRRSCSEATALLREDDLDPEQCIFAFDLNRLKYANDTYGHKAGDELLVAAATIIETNFPTAQCFRTGGDEFIAYATGIDPEKVARAVKVSCLKWKGLYMPTISISVGYASAKENPEMDFDQLSALADSRMYDDKKKFYEESGFDRRQT